jgi:MSHA biogenesis protein MshJ
MVDIKEVQNKIDSLSVRERAAVFFCTLLVMYFVWDVFFIQSLQITEKRAKSQLQQKQAEQFGLTTQLQKLDLGTKVDPNKADRNTLQSLKSQLSVIEAEVQASTKNLISPKDMAVMLESVLLEVKGLKLLEVKGLGGQPIIKVKAVEKNAEGAEEPATEPEKDKIINNAYKHGLKIVFEGDYMSTLKYIQALEDLKWGFFWDSLELNVKEYPDSTVSITLFTLSLDKNWIGV